MCNIQQDLWELFIYMHYFKHSELEKKYRVSLKTIHNWIDAAKLNKLSLRLHVEHGRTYIANTPANVTALEELAQQGKKYRNSRFHKTVTPNPAFYEYYTHRQILEMISNMEVRREIPFKYSYLDGGATKWENVVTHMEDQKGTNNLNGTINLINANLGAIDMLLDGHSRVNVVDVGLGNARPSKELIGHLVNRGILHRYIGVDISQAMLDIADRNVKEWFGGKVKFEGHVRDIDFERFDDLLMSDMLGDQANETINLVLLLGGTPVGFPSFSEAFRIIHGSMGVNDLLLFTGKPDTEASRRYFDFSRIQETSPFPPIVRFLPELMGIDPSLYDAEMGYDEQKRMRFMRIRLKTALTIDFQFKEGSRKVSLEKGDVLLLWRAWHLTSLEMISALEDRGFKLLQAGSTKNRQYMITIFGINTQHSLDS